MNTHTHPQPVVRNPEPPRVLPTQADLHLRALARRARNSESLS